MPRPTGCDRRRVLCRCISRRLCRIMTSREPNQRANRHHHTLTEAVCGVAARPRSFQRTPTPDPSRFRGLRSPWTGKGTQPIEFVSCRAVYGRVCCRARSGNGALPCPLSPVLLAAVDGSLCIGAVAAAFSSAHWSAASPGSDSDQPDSGGCEGQGRRNTVAGRGQRAVGGGASRRP